MDVDYYDIREYAENCAIARDKHAAIKRTLQERDAMKLAQSQEKKKDRLSNSFVKDGKEKLGSLLSDMTDLLNTKQKEKVFHSLKISVELLTEISMEKADCWNSR